MRGYRSKEMVTKIHVLPSQSAPNGAASSPIGGAKGCGNSGSPNYNCSIGGVDSTYDKYLNKV